MVEALTTKQTLQKLSEDFCLKAEEYKNRKEIQAELDTLLVRFQHVTVLRLKAEGLSNICDLYNSKGIKYTIPKKKLSGRIKSLGELLKKYNKNKHIILESKIIDMDSYDAAFAEIEQKLIDAWKLFSTYDKRAVSLSKIEQEDAPIKLLIEKIKKNIQIIDSYSSTLPLEEKTIDEVAAKKNEIERFSDQIDAQGLSEDVGKFLLETRESGFSLSKVLENDSILKYLKEQKRANLFVVKHK